MLINRVGKNAHLCSVSFFGYFHQYNLFFPFWQTCYFYVWKCQLSLTRYKSLERGKVLGPGNGSNVVIAVCYSRQADIELVSQRSLPNVKETGKF